MGGKNSKPKRLPKQSLASQREATPTRGGAGALARLNKELVAFANESIAADPARDWSTQLAVFVRRMQQLQSQQTHTATASVDLCDVGEPAGPSPPETAAPKPQQETPEENRACEEPDKLENAYRDVVHFDASVFEGDRDERRRKTRRQREYLTLRAREEDAALDQVQHAAKRAPALSPATATVTVTTEATASTQDSAETAPQRELEKQLMELLMRTTEAQEQLRGQHDQYFTMIGSHASEVNELSKALERMEHNLDHQGLEPPAFDGFRAAPDLLSRWCVWQDATLRGLRVDQSGPYPSDQGTPSDVSLGQLSNATTSTVCAVAIKRLPASVSLQDASAFASDVAAISKLCHPRIVLLVGVAWDKGVDIQVAMEPVQDGDFQSLLQSDAASTLSWSEFKCAVTIDVAEALVYLHSVGFAISLTGVLSSTKVLLSPEGAKLNVLCGPRVFPGGSRARWLAPECLRVDGVATDKSDIYSFGVLLCVLDSTHEPYHDVVNPNGVKMEDELLAVRVASGELTPTVTASCPDGIATLARQCLAFDPAKRPSAESIVYTLREILKNEL